MRQALHAQERHSSEEDGLLLLAERHVQRRVWLLKTLPLHLILILPGLLFVGTRSKRVLAIFVATYPLLLVVRALLARGLSAWIGPEEVLVRTELEKLRRSDSVVSQDGRSASA